MADIKTVKFLQGTQENYNNIAVKDPNTFYFTGTNLYLGTIKLNDAENLDQTITDVTQLKTDVSNLKAAVGTLDNLTTTQKTDLVTAINEVLTKITDATNASKVTLEESASAEFAKVYTVKQGETTVGTINIPKDMVVSAGAIEVNPAGQDPGTYIVLTIANAASDKLYINVASLADVYTAAADAPQVQLAIDSTTREISASIVAGSVTATELAANAVTTVKIADGNVTVEKLSSGIQTSLGKADSAVQSITEGTTNGTISVDGASVSVHGLGEAAYKKVSDFDAAGAATTALNDAKAYADSLVSWGSF